jgi:hypothetical protein
MDSETGVQIRRAMNMNPKKIAFLLFIGVLVIGYGFADDFTLGVSADKDGVKDFHLAIGSHYKVSEKAIALGKKKGLQDNELPVLFYLSAQTGKKPEALLELRRKGKSWMDISFHFGLGAGAFYVPLKEVKGPPYGKAYGHFKNTPRKKWNSIVLTDADIVNFVNLKFLSVHYGCSPDEVVKMKAKGKSFASINAKIKANKKADKALKSAGVKIQGKGISIKCGKPSPGKCGKGKKK